MIQYEEEAFPRKKIKNAIMDNHYNYIDDEIIDFPITGLSITLYKQIIIKMNKRYNKRLHNIFLNHI